MHQNIGVRVPVGTEVGLDLDTTYNERAALDEPVDVCTKTYAIGHLPSFANRASATTRSSGSVTLMFQGLPSTAAISMPSFSTR